MSADSTRRRRDAVAGFESRATVRPDGMNYWRWLLFVAMARLEQREDVFFELPNATTIPREVRLGTCTDELRRW